MAGRFARGLVTGLVLGGCVAVAAALVTPPPGGDATAASPEPVAVERTYGPQPSALPRLRSETAPAEPSRAAVQ